MKMNGLNPRPIIIKIIPPIYSHFHATIRNASKINEGMRCMIKAPSCCQMLSSGVKASAANKLTKRIARMQIIRGNQ
jgi:hypothetical protein